MRTEYYKQDEDFIIKVQLPLFTNEEVPQALIYDEHRIIEHMCPVDKDILDIMEGEPKAFFHAHMQEDGQIAIDADKGEVADPGW